MLKVRDGETVAVTSTDSMVAISIFEASMVLGTASRSAMVTTEISAVPDAAVLLGLRRLKSVLLPTVMVIGVLEAMLEVKGIVIFNKLEPVLVVMVDDLVKPDTTTSLLFRVLKSKPAVSGMRSLGVPVAGRVTKKLPLATDERVVKVMVWMDDVLRKIPGVLA